MSTAPENRDETRPDLATRWKPGVSGNPGGRPKGSAKAVREALGGSPSELAHGLLEIFRDEKQRSADRIAAGRELWDRGWGKAPAFASVEGGDPLELDEVSRAIEAIQDELAARREARSL